MNDYATMGKPMFLVALSPRGSDRNRRDFPISHLFLGPRALLSPLTSRVGQFWGVCETTLDCSREDVENTEEEKSLSRPNSAWQHEIGSRVFFS